MKTCIKRGDMPTSSGQGPRKDSLKAEQRRREGAGQDLQRRGLWAGKWVGGVTAGL